MATKATTTGISIRKNRSYSTDLTWTDDMNNNLHMLYNEARNKPDKNGYTNTLKRLWDEKYPEYNQLSVRHLSQQARDAVKRRKQAEESQQQLQQQQQQPPQQQQQQQLPEELEEQPNTPVEPPAEPPPPGVENSEEVENVIQTEELKESFLRNYEKYRDVELQDREYSTRCDFRLDQIVMEKFNAIIKDYKQSLSELTFWDVNVICYASAVTLIEKYGKLRECKAGGRNVDSKRPWELQLTHQINSIRRKISHIGLTQDCLMKNSFTKKQRSVSKVVKKLCGSLQKESLSSKLALLKHDLLVCNTKLADMKTKAERSRINNQFLKNQKQVFRD